MVAISLIEWDRPRGSSFVMLKVGQNELFPPKSKLFSRPFDNLDINTGTKPTALSDCLLLKINFSFFFSCLALVSHSGYQSGKSKRKVNH